MNAPAERLDVPTDADTITYATADLTHTINAISDGGGDTRDNAGGPDAYSCCNEATPVNTKVLRRVGFLPLGPTEMSVL
jgi:hypothetical protein